MSKMNKKRLAFLLTGAMLLGAALAGCGDSNTSGADGGSATTTGASTTTDSTDNAPIKTAQDGVLTMATNAFFPPYEFYEGDEIVGIDAEVGKAIADKLGLEFEIADMDFETIITAIQSGKADMGMAGMTVTEDRLKNVDFSQSYATGVQVVIVPEDSDIASPDDLMGKLIGVQTGTTGDIYASDTPEKGGFGEDAVVQYSKGADAIVALQQDKVDAVIIDNEPAKAFVAANEGLKILETEYVNEDYAIAFSKDNAPLRDAVDTALGELIADGTVQGIVDKYITAE